MFSQVSVILITGGRVWQIPPWADTPWSDPPHSRRLLQRTVRILLECILVINAMTDKHMANMPFLQEEHLLLTCIQIVDNDCL